MLKKHDYDGACKPSSCYDTFSVGVFRWVPTVDGEEMKRSKVKVRISGSCGKPNLVYKKAAEVVVALDEDKYSGPKYIKV